jgi:hypothetical protein
MNSNQKSMITFALLAPFTVPWGLAKMQWQKWFPTKTAKAIDQSNSEYAAYKAWKAKQLPDGHKDN